MAVKAPSHTSRGYQVNFVEQPSKEIQVECPVCLNVLFEPKLAVCCGHSFCAACIDPIESDRKPCPMCNQQIMLVDDKRLERTLNGLTVYCPQKEKGCEWTGELGEVNNHLNRQPTTDSLLKGCQFQEILCEVCQSHRCERQLMEDHVSTKCPEREIECEYHYVGCDFKGLQVELDGHISEAMNVHLSLLAKFVQSGLSQKDNEIEKLKEELNQQGEVNAVQIQQLTEQSQQVQQQCTEQSRKYRQLKKRINLYWLLILFLFLVAGGVDAFLYLALNSESALRNCSQSLQEEQLSSLYLKKIDIAGLDEQMLQLNRDATRTNTDIKNLGGQVQQIKDGTAQIRTKLKAKVDELKLAISKSTQGVEGITNDMSKVKKSLVDIQQMQSEQMLQLNHDAARTNTDIKSLGAQVQQIKDGTAQIRTKLKAKVDELKLAISKSTHDVEGITNDMSKVKQSLVDIQRKQSEQKSKKPQESCTCGLRVTTEEIQLIRSEVQHLSEQVDFPTLPCKFNLTHLREQRDSKSRWLSMPFYTREGGYKMRLVVHPDGVKSGAGTHVSVALHLMNGRYDDQLDWPPNITLNVTLFDQLSAESDHHIIKSFTFSQYHRDSTVINKVWRDTMARNGIQISQFASHHIALVPAKSHSHLKHDSLYFGVEMEIVDDKRWYSWS